ncbi:MAG: GNAT family N-acetyltransferase [Gemmatimonadaceae bacterium]|nr:GNAT family N-acetyltransferase [Gemmatimonadaceae bacterium]NUQ93255.1 GNAT family N-acetyltransferase [Gemmatimonadaceae bacterium]NUR18912.1 GNAT family N-acetyltransferase [Gemmatimonadaceae bacterium]NUS98513.1 GNAT family N-acetyltransferase [Gemmatimonadaceae bacterium]
MRLTLDLSPKPSDEQVIFAGLRAFNVAVIGDPHESPVDVFARDENGRVIGGLVGHIKWRWLYVAKLWLPDGLRGTGVGTEIMRMAEEHAWKEGCLGVHLDTFEYQALPFYQKLGYELFGTLEGYPPGYRQYYLKKTRPVGQ